MNKLIVFETDIFEEGLKKEEFINPGIYGEQLAKWTKEKLTEQGVKNEEDIIGEDWGWIVMVHSKPYRLWVGCGNEIDISGENKTKRWKIFIEAEQGFLKKLFKPIDTSKDVASLESTVMKILEEAPEISNIELEEG